MPACSQPTAAPKNQPIAKCLYYAGHNIFSNRFGSGLIFIVYSLAASRIHRAYCAADERVAHGSAAVDHLGTKVSTIARFYGIESGLQLRDLLLRDPDLGVDTVNNDGSLLLFSCRAPSSGARRLLHAHNSSEASSQRPHAHSHSHGHSASQAHRHRRLAASSAAGHHAGAHHDKAKAKAAKAEHEAKYAAHKDHEHHEQHEQHEQHKHQGSPRRRLQQDLAPAMPDPAPSSLPQAASGLPLLHSRPAASHKIFLDFDGHNASGTSWNYLAGRAVITTPAYAHSDTFTPSEQADVIAIWRAVSEDFSPFNVDVTTEDPGPDALRLTGGYDSAFGVRVCIGGSSWEWYGRALAGAAYLGSFSWDSDTPAYVFPQQLGPRSAKYVWEAVSHVVGHSLGLYHDGDGSGAYYAGHGDWAPIMGSAYFRPISQWSRGEYPGASNQQDDLSIMAAYLQLASDMLGSSQDNATTISSGAVMSGVLGPASAGHWYRVSAAPGQLTLEADVLTPYGSHSRANLDVALLLTDAWGGLLGSADPAAEGDVLYSLPAALEVHIASPGTYYIQVRRAGAGSPLSGGYSEYGSVGQYALTATFASMVAGEGGDAEPLLRPQPPLPAVVPAPSNVPAAPLLLAVRASKVRRMQVQFEDRSSGESSFQVQRCAGPAPCGVYSTALVVFSTSAAGTGQSYTAADMVPLPGTLYTYRVLACSATTGLCSAPSNIITATSLK